MIDAVEPDPRTFIPNNTALPALPEAADNEGPPAPADNQGPSPQQIRIAQLALLSQYQALALLKGDALAAYQLADSQYQTKHKEYASRRKALMGVDELIITTTTTYAMILQRLEGPHARLQALNRHVAPSQQSLQIEARRSYQCVRG